MCRRSPCYKDSTYKSIARLRSRAAPQIFFEHGSRHPVGLAGLRPAFLNNNAIYAIPPFCIERRPAQWPRQGQSRLWRGFGLQPLDSHYASAQVDSITRDAWIQRLPEHADWGRRDICRREKTVPRRRGLCGCQDG